MSQRTSTHYQLTEADFSPVEPSVISLPVTSYSEDGGYVGWGHIPESEFADAVNSLEDYWGVVDFPEDRFTAEDVRYVHLIGSEVNGDVMWNVCSAETPGAVAATMLNEYL